MQYDISNIRSFQLNNVTSEFENSLIDDNAVDSMFDSLGDDWFAVGDDDLSLDLNPWDADVVTNH